MTPKETAIKLVGKYIPHVKTTAFTVVEIKKQLKENAKQCAFICVNEIISITNPILEMIDCKEENYWVKVKEELNKL